MCFKMFVVFFSVTELFLLNAQSLNEIFINKNIQLHPLEDSVFVHISYENSEQFGRFPSNGLVIVNNGKGVLVDTPFDNAKTEALFRYLKDTMQVSVTQLIIGHSHHDCMGGLEYLQKHGVESIASKLTVDICRTTGLPIPTLAFSDFLSFDFQGMQIECRYFGGGHTKDNIVVWLPTQKILFGGCLIRSARARNLGYIKEAVVADWDTTVAAIIAAYPDIQTVVPGHGAVGGTELLEHSIDLVRAEKGQAESMMN